MAAPEISVVVPSHGRRLRLWWLLNALEVQDLAAERFEVVVVHDYDSSVTRVLERHPLVAAGRARLIAIEPGTGSPARQRNIGWRSANAPVIAFTDDDCRPEPTWLGILLDRFPGSADDVIVQGTTRPDPIEEANFAAPHHRSLSVDPPNLFAQTCNIAYPSSLLDRLDGFDEALVAGEDTDLALRARKGGAEVLPAPEARVFHAVEAFTLPEVIRMTSKWGYLPGVLRRHPELRRTLPLGVFWRQTHAELLLGALGVAIARRKPLAAALTLPYLRRRFLRRGWSKRGVLASTVELPGQVVVDTAEVLTMVRGSIRHRAPML